MFLTHVILACDESGAKGYADQGEQYPGQVGVFAGIMVPVEVFSLVKADFDAFIHQYIPARGKLHISDLSANQKQTLRDGCFNLIRKHKLNPILNYCLKIKDKNTKRQFIK